MPKNLEQSIFAALSNAAAVTGIAGQRVYPNRLPQGATYPSVMYFKASNVDGYNMQGNDGVPTARIQVNSYAEKYQEAKDLAAAVKGVLDGFIGTLGSGGVNVLGIFRDNDFDDYDDELKKEVVVQDFLITYDA